MHTTPKVNFKQKTMTYNILTLFFLVVTCLNGYAQKGVFKYIYDEHAKHLDKILTKHPEDMNFVYTGDFIDPITKENKQYEYHLLEYAAYTHQFECVKVILKHLSDAQNKQETLDQALAEIIQHGSLEMVKLLVDAGADINYKSEAFHGRSIIMEAVQYNHIEIFEYLMSFKPSLEGKDKEGRNIFHIAATHDNDTIIGTLFEQHQLRDEKDFLGGTPLVYATYHCSLDNFLKFHEKSDYHVLTEDNEDLVHFAARNNVDTNVLLYVLSKDSLDINIQDKYGITPIMYAIYNHLYYNNPHTIRILLREDINTKLKDEQGLDMLHYAIDTQDLDVVKMVYKKDPSLLDKEHIKFANHIVAKRSINRWLHKTYRKAKKTS